MITIELSENGEITLYNIEDTSCIQDTTERKYYENTFSLMNKINKILKIEKLPYLAFVDGLLKFDIGSDSWDYIEGESLNKEDYELDNNVVLIDSNYKEDEIGLEMLLSHEMRHVWQFYHLTREQRGDNMFNEWHERFVEVDAVAFEMLYTRNVMNINKDLEYAEKKMDAEVRKRIIEIEDTLKI